MNRSLTDLIKGEILGMGMDLVGFAPVERWKDAPYLLSPPAILPEGKTVVVAGIHITDTWTEMGGTPEPQDRSPGGWLSQNELMDRISFRVVRRLNEAGHQAIAVVSSNIWRYRQYEGIPSLFAPDLSHIHAATAAGLAEIGWCGLAITPEFGSRVRFLSVVTDAELVPSPMYDGPKLCDMCGECVKHCPSLAMVKDFNDKPHVVTIGGKTYRYANKNIWRCAWAEHFNLDLNSATLKQDHIDENVILNELQNAGVRGHERGVCQKVCVPPHLRSDKPSFGRPDRMIAQNRINKRYPDTMPTLRKLRDDLIARAVSYGIEVASVAPLKAGTPGAALAESDAPGMKTVFGFALRQPEYLDRDFPLNNVRNSDYFYRQKMHFALLRLGRMMEDFGYHAATYTIHNRTQSSAAELDLAAQSGIGKMVDGRVSTPEFGPYVVLGCLTTDAVIDPTPELNGALEPSALKKLVGKELRSDLECTARQNLMTLFGVAPAARIDGIADQLKGVVNEAELSERVTDVNRRLSYHGEFIPEIGSDGTRLARSTDYLPNAKSVIVIGTYFADELVRNLALPESQQIGCYGFMGFQVPYEIHFAALELGLRLQKMGYQFRIADNLLGVGSRIGSARGEQPDMRCGALEAVAAGLGEIGEQGALLTAEHGPHQRVIAIVTDAELPADLVQATSVCLHCHQCEAKCTVGAIEQKYAGLKVEGVEVKYPLVPRHRCDWAKRYSLVPEEGPGILGNITDAKVPDGKVTIQDIAEGCKRKDPVMKSRTCIFEPCLRHCPAGAGSEKRLAK